MRFPRLRFTLRQVMVAVTLVAVLLAAGIRRRDYCLRMAARHAQDEARGRAVLRSARAIATALLAANVVDNHAELRSRYQWAASRPWESLPDDPSLNEPPGTDIPARSTERGRFWYSSPE